jgi:chromosome segregation ATPase
VIEDLRGQLEHMRKGDLNQVIKRYESEIGKIKSAHKAETENLQCQLEELSSIVHRTEQELILKESQMLDAIATSHLDGEKTSNASQQTSILIDGLRRELSDLRGQCKLYREDQTLTELLKRLTLNGNDMAIAANNLPFSEYTKLVEANRSKTNQLADLRNQLRESREEKYSLKLHTAEYEKMLADAQSQFESMREQEMNLYRELSERDGHILNLEQQLKDYETDESLLAEIEKELRQLRSANEQLKTLHEQERAAAEFAITEKERAILEMRMSFERDMEHYKEVHEENERRAMEMSKKQLESIFEARLHHLQTQLDEKEHHLVAREKDMVSALQESEQKFHELRHEKEMELLRIKRHLLAEKEKQLEELYLQSETERREAIGSVEATFLPQVEHLKATIEQQTSEIAQLNSQLAAMTVQKETSAYVHEETIQRLNHEWTNRLATDVKWVKQEAQAAFEEHKKKLQEDFDHAIQELKTEHEDIIQSLKYHYQKQYETQLNEASAAHEVTIKELDSHWEAHLQSELTRIQHQFTEQYTDELQRMETQYTDELHDMRKQYEHTLAQLDVSQQHVQSLEMDIYTLREHIYDIESQKSSVPVRIDQSIQSDPIPQASQNLAAADVQRFEEKLKEKCKKAYERALNQMKEEFLEYERRLYERVRRERYHHDLKDKENPHHGMVRKSHRQLTQNLSDRVPTIPAFERSHPYY